jgi:hypothetical protein
MLVALPIHAESLDMNGGMHATGHATAPMSSMPMATTKSASSGHCASAVSVKVPVHAEDCCRGGDHGSAATCHCAATFGTALVALSMTELLVVMSGDVHPETTETAAPDIDDGPPLRPPSV